MTSLNYEGLFQGWEIAVAKTVINRFIKKWKCLEHEGFDDLLQECLAEWHFSKIRYKSDTGANIRTFMAGVVEHKLQYIIERLTTDKRKVAHESFSLNERISDEKDSPTFLDQLSDDQTHVSNLHISAYLKIDIKRTIEKLTPQQQELCRLLYEEGLNILEASDAMRVPRSTLYDDIRRIRTIFQQDGLHEYL